MIPYGKQSITQEDIDAVVSVLKSDFLTTGPKVAEFELAMSQYVGAKNCVAVNSGTSALDIAVGALELPPGSEIITTAFTFVASSNCILYNNHKPIFADIDPETYNISPEQVRKKITKKTKAIVYVDYAGQPCNLRELREIADAYNLKLIEDACHALGAEYMGKKIGSSADITVFSFHPVKHITTGEGGAVTTEDEALHTKLRLLRNHGIDKTPSERGSGYAYDMKMLGRNYRITDIQCALGVSQLKRMDALLKRREEIAELYTKELGEVRQITLPFVKQEVRHSYHLYPILVDRKIKRDMFFNLMRENGIGVNVHYIPAYRFAYYQQFRINPKDYPVTEDVSSREISIPMYPGMGDTEVHEVCDAVRDSLRRCDE